MMNRFLLLLILIIFTLTSYGQNEPLVTDRPDVTESALVIPKGLYQLEIGANFENSYSSDQNWQAVNIPSFLMRIGLNNRVELRIGSTYSIFDDQSIDNPVDANGFNASELGVKVNLNEFNDAKVKHGLIAGVGVPYLAASNLRANTFTTPTLLYLIQFDINDWLTFSSNIGGVWDAKGGAGSFRYSGSFAFGITERLGAFVEGFGNVVEGGSHTSN